MPRLLRGSPKRSSSRLSFFHRFPCSPPVHQMCSESTATCRTLCEPILSFTNSIAFRALGPIARHRKTRHSEFCCSWRCSKPKCETPASERIFEKTAPPLPSNAPTQCEGTVNANHSFPSRPVWVRVSCDCSAGDSARGERETCDVAEWYVLCDVCDKYDETDDASSSSSPSPPPPP